MKRTEKLVTLTPDKCEEYLKFNVFDGQRRLSDKYALELATKMESGRFHVGNVAIVHRGDETLLADGQHQLTACTLSQVPFKAVLQEYHLNGEDDEQAMARVFSQFNVDRVRQRGDIAWIYACELGWQSWSRRTVTIAASALTIAEKGDGTYGSDLSKDESAALLAANVRVCEWLNAMEIGSCRHLRRAPVAAAMVMTWRKSQKAASEFWTAVKDGDMLAKGDPRHTLREFLLSATLHGGNARSSRDGKEAVDCRAVGAKCIHAWNAWRRGEQTNLKYYATAAFPKPV